MWSEIFTHDDKNGDKIAIILLDTQGTFDTRSSIHDFTTLFAMSTMLSSIQIFNVMQDITENDLHNLRLFTEYARLGVCDDDQNKVKPFQHLIFLVRDWPYADDIKYGWEGKKLIDEIFSENIDRTSDMTKLRKQIEISFEKITAFLMPYPGDTVAQGKRYAGNVNDLSADFKRYLDKLVTSILDPKKLIVKKIDGKPIQAGELIEFIEKCHSFFSDEELPKAKDILTVCSKFVMSLQMLQSHFVYHIIVY